MGFTVGTPACHGKSKGGVRLIIEMRPILGNLRYILSLVIFEVFKFCLHPIKVWNDILENQ